MASTQDAIEAVALDVEAALAFQPNIPTLYLCAAAHNDSQWRNRILRDFTSYFNARSPCFTVDMAAVMAHCLWAAQRALIASALLLLCLVIAVVALLHLNLLLCLASVVAALAISASYEASTARILRLFQSRRFTKLDASNRLLPFLRDLPQRYADQFSDNVVVYSGFSPFVGSGRPSKPSGWVESIDLDRGASDADGTVLQPEAFNTSDLYACVRRALLDLKLPDLAVVDRLFADGRAIRDDRWLLPNIVGRPVARINPQFVRSFLDGQAQHARHYLCAHLSGWGGDVYISVYIRFSQVGTHLRCDVTYRFLAPIRDEFRVVDSQPPFYYDLHRWALRAVKLESARSILRDAALMIGNRLAAEEEVRRLRYQARRVPTFNYGGHQSHREYVSARGVDRLYQYLDREHAILAVNGAILSALVRLLDEKHIDTSGLVKRSASIFNQAITITESDVDVENMIVGNNNRVSSGRTDNPVKDDQEKGSKT